MGAISLDNCQNLGHSSSASFELMMVQTLLCGGWALVPNLELEMLDKHSYCVKCQSAKTIIGQSPVIMKNGSFALKGECPSCKTTSYKIVNKHAIQAQQRPISMINKLALLALSISGGAVLGMILHRFI